MAEAVQVTPAEVARSVAEGVKGGPTFVDRVATKVDQVDGEATLNMAAQKTINFDLIREKNNENFGLRNKDGNKVRASGSAEEKRYKEAQKTIDMAEDFHKNGYENMTNARLKSDLLAIAKKAVANDPVLRDYLATLPATTANNLAEARAREFLRDPILRDKVVQLLVQRGDITQLIDDNVSKIEIELSQLKESNTKLEAEKKTIVTEIDLLEKEAAEYTSVKKGKTPKTGKYDLQKTKLSSEIKTIDDDTADLNDQIETIDSEIDMAKTTMNASRSSQPERDDARDRWTRSLAEKQKYKKRVNAKLGEKTVKEKEIEAIDQKEKEITTKIAEKKKELKEKIEDVISQNTKTISERNPELAKLKSERSLREKDYLLSIQSVFSEAVTDRISAQVKETLAQGKLILEKDAAETKDAREKKVLEDLSKRYFDKDFKAKTSNISGDYGELMAAGAEISFSWPETTGGVHTEKIFLNGAERALAKVLGFNPTGGSTTANKEIYEMIKDPAYREAMAPRVAKEILVAKLWTGHLSKGEVLAIEHSTWGAGMVAQALEGKTNMKGVVDNLIGKDVLNWGDNLKEQLKKLDWTKMLMILLAIAGLVGGVALLKK